MTVGHLGACTQHVQEGASRVDLAALNAMLSAHRAGLRARGFRTAASQMRRFSLDLSEQMQTVTEIVAGLSDAVARQRKHHRATRQIETARELSTQPSHQLNALLADLIHQQGQAHHALGQQTRRLFVHVRTALRLCDAGRNLARCALIEAAHAQDMALQLTQVAIDLGEAVNHIIDALKAMQLQLEALTP
ncbi:MAG TPA: hypothetical protein VEQ09_09930 [Aquabacterium sp.]|nr:hypothetical protein [Aquabacterium sp.]